MLICSSGCDITANIQKMTFAEYREKVYEGLKGYGIPQEYVKKIEEDTRNQYEHDTISTDQLGTDMMNPSGFVYTCYMLYPDTPDVPPVKNPFNFKFSKA